LTVNRFQLHRQIVAGVDPRHLLSKIIGNTDSIPPDVSDLTLWRIIANSLAQPRRKKLINTNSIDDVCNLLRTSKNIIVLTGAGVSVSCGIPDFRSRDGIYARLAVEYPDLPDPQAMFDIRYFSQDPRPFFKFAREIYPGQFKPSPVHRFIRKLEERGQLLRNYTQNIDTLENIAGIKNVIECHGSFASASCTKCKAQVTAAAIEKDVFEQRIPLCPLCNPNAVSPKSCELRTQDPTLLQQLVANGIMKPDIVFFGEGLPELFHNTIDADRAKCDLLIVIGSSLKVRPVALIPSWISAQVPQILINREPLHHLDFDINLLGDSDVIVNQLCHM
jgi:NAD+-dependent protein deacetylase sirtuin 1